jgi:hypothetical protein
MIAIAIFGFGQIHLLFAETRQDNFYWLAKILNIRVLFWQRYKKDGLLDVFFKRIKCLILFWFLVADFKRFIFS